MKKIVFIFITFITLTLNACQDAPVNEGIAHIDEDIITQGIQTEDIQTEYIQVENIKVEYVVAFGDSKAIDWILESYESADAEGALLVGPGELRDRTYHISVSLTEKGKANNVIISSVYMFIEDVDTGKFVIIELSTSEISNEENFVITDEYMPDYESFIVGFYAINEKNELLTWGFQGNIHNK
jgi:hypothetical protein